MLCLSYSSCISLACISEHISSRERECRKAEELPKTCILENEKGHIYRRNRGQIISATNGQLMHPPLRYPVVPPFRDSHRSPHLSETEQSASTEAEVPIKFTTDAHRSSISTRSGRQSKKPERHFESCKRGDVVMLLNRDPWDSGSPDVFLGHPADCCGRHV